MIKKIAFQQEILQSIIEVAQIHAKRLKYAMKKLNSYFPISPETILTLSEDELPLFELYTSRFSKLQDLMGNALYPKLLASTGEPVDEMTFIDRLNRLEKLGVIDDAENWMKMRQIRNHLSHEYPDQPELTAEYLNDAFDFGVTLLRYLEKTIQFSKI
ncbi:MAG: hypothetical protein KBD83_07270 [Gammaproteobacteria bacterium]|nr:hypothetical protein [Gammaproteobacteria bacterium]